MVILFPVRNMQVAKVVAPKKAALKEAEGSYEESHGGAAGQAGRA